jgi:hypothetical protein
MADPLHAVRRLSTSDPPMVDSSATQRRQKFLDCLTADNISIVELRKLAWSGIPDELRPISWQLLLVRHLYIPHTINLPTPLTHFVIHRVTSRSLPRHAPQPLLASAKNTPRS